MPPPPEQVSVRSWCILGILTLVFLTSYIDRYLVSILIQPLRRDLQLSDTQIGLIAGLVFAVAYGGFSLPIARLADMRGRRGVIVVSLAIWSAMTALAGAVTSFWQLACVRFGLGAGESGCGPASQAIITDLFPEKRRNFAMAVFGSAGSMGMVLAFAVGGYLESKFGWRWTFVIAGMFSFFIALLVRITVPEAGSPQATPRPAQPLEMHGSRVAFVKTLTDLWSNPLFRHMPFVYATVSLLMFAQTQWLPAFLERSFGVPRAELGLKLALVLGPSMFAGTIIGGFIADQLVRRTLLGPLQLIAACLVMALLPEFYLYRSVTAEHVYIFSAISGFLVSVPAGPAFSFVQSNVARSERATAAAVCILVSMVLGSGGGTLLIGFLSDRLAPSLGIESLRWSLMTTAMIVTPWSLFHVGAVYISYRRHLSSLSSYPS